MGLSKQAWREDLGKRAFIILGMHRSGTSSVAGALTLLGAAPPRTLMVAAADNPKGFFESRLIGELNDRILQAAGSSWDDWRRFDPAMLRPDATATFREEILATLRGEFAAEGLIVLKDPRLCRLYPIWQDVLEEEGYQADFILPVRSPLEVARSLNRRNGMPIAGGLLLWLRHVLEAEKLTRLQGRRILLWRAFMRDWQSEVALIQKQLAWDVEVTDARSRDIDAFLSVDLQHEIVADDALVVDPEAHVWALAVYEALVGLTVGDHDADHLTTLDRVAAVFETSCQLYGPAHQPFVRRVELLEAELANQVSRSEERGSEQSPLQDVPLTRQQRIDRALSAAANLATTREQARVAFGTALQNSDAHLRRIQRARQTSAA